MKIAKIYKPLIALVLCLAAGPACFAQADTVQPVPPAPQIADIPQPPAAPVVTGITAKSTGWVAAQVHTLKSVIASVKEQADEAVKEVNVQVKGYSGNDNQQQANTLFKNYGKVYPINGDDRLVLDNSYGHIIINTWDKNEFKVDVQVKATANSPSIAQDILDDVTISDGKDGQGVAFKTNIDQGKSIWKTIFGGGNWGSHSLEVDYTVYMPAKNELVIRNRYGAINLPEMNGKVTLECSYGSVTAKAMNSESAIRVRYGNLDVGNMGTTAIDLSYGNLTAGSIGRIEANITYSGTNIGKIRESGAFNVRYGGGLKISDLDKNVNNLAINSTYTSVNIGLSGDENASFDIQVHYGDFNYNSRAITITGKTPGDNQHGSHSTKTYKGFLGSGNSGKNISINSSYGSVQFD